MTKDDELRKKARDWIADDERVQLQLGRALDAQERAAKAHDQHTRVAAERDAMAAWVAFRRLTGERDMIRRRAIEHAVGEHGGGTFAGWSFDEIVRPELFKTPAGAAFGYNMMARMLTDMTEDGDRFERAAIGHLRNAAQGYATPFEFRPVPGGRGVHFACGPEKSAQELVVSKAGYTAGAQGLVTKAGKKRLYDGVERFYVGLVAKYDGRLPPRERETFRYWFGKLHRELFQTALAEGKSDAAAGRVRPDRLLPE